MSARATVLVPTHDHGRTLSVAVASALAQTRQDLEVLIVGDGISAAGREAATELAASDERVSFFDNPKGERHGEEHRHRALASATGSAVLYLADDDIWLPRHVESLMPLLERADFVGGTVVRVREGGGLEPLAHDLARERARKLFLHGFNRLPLSGAAHTMAAYRGFERGWTPAPQGIATDLHFYQGFLASPECSAMSCQRPTVLSFPAAWRPETTPADRLAELEHWWQRVRDPDGLAAVEREIASSWQGAALEAGMREQSLRRSLRGKRTPRKQRRRLRGRLRRLLRR